MTTKKTDWKSADSIAQLATLWFDEGLKDAAVAVRMGCTANAIRSVRGRLAEAQPERGWTDATRVKTGTKRAERIAACSQRTPRSRTRACYDDPELAAALRRAGDERVRRYYRHPDVQDHVSSTILAQLVRETDRAVLDKFAAQDPKSWAIGQEAIHYAQSEEAARMSARIASDLAQIDSTPNEICAEYRSASASEVSP